MKWYVREFSGKMMKKTQRVRKCARQSYVSAVAMRATRANVYFSKVRIRICNGKAQRHRKR